MEIIRGTTPTLIFTFDTVNVEQMSVAKLLIKQNGKTIIEKELSDATISDGSLSYQLTQTETLNLITELSAQICLDWKTTEGIRGRSKVYESAVRPAGYEGVL